MTRIRTHNTKTFEWDSSLTYEEKAAQLEERGWVKVGESIDAEAKTWTRWRLNDEIECEVMKE